MSPVLWRLIRTGIIRYRQHDAIIAKDIKMKRNVLLIFLVSLYISGCSINTPKNTYANNPFNPWPYKDKAVDNQAPSPRTAVRAADIGLTAASPSIPGALPTGASIGIASALLLLGGSGSSQPHVQPASFANYLNITMPINEAPNEREAEEKIFNTLKLAIVESVPKNYVIKKVEYNDIFNGKSFKREWYLVNGERCENWSCQLIPLLEQDFVSPIRTKILEIKEIKNKKRYIFNIQQAVSLVKVKKDYLMNEGENLKVRVVDGTEITGFDYPTFYDNISSRFPEWACIIYKSNDKQYASYKGLSLPISGWKLPFDIP